MTCTCVWCSREFIPRPTATPNYYQLESAGTSICWSCSDLFDEAEVGLHFDVLSCKVDSSNRFFTENGHLMPFIMKQWNKSPFRRKRKACVIDSFGKFWSAKADQHKVTLKPIGA